MNPPVGGIAVDGTASHSKPQQSNSVSQYSLPTRSIHADDHLNTSSDVAPPLHVSTTFRYTSNPAELLPAADVDDSLPLDTHVYSRETAPTSTRLESILTSIIHAPTLTYSSGLSALFAAYTLLKPTRVAIGNGYHGSHAVLRIHAKLTGLQVLPLDCPAAELQPGDVVHLETPINPTGEVFDIQMYADKAHSRGAYLLVDSTFSPPGLQDPFLWGADVVMHSGTKYFGGHSDLLFGTLSTRKEEWIRILALERMAMGGVMGSLEGWLGVRSLRTLEVRVQRASLNTTGLVAWLAWCLNGAGKGEEGRVVKKVVERVQHASLQADEKGFGFLKEQMPSGYGPVFAVTMKGEEMARRLPSKLALFHHATSLGGVESLIEWRTMSDKTVDRRLLRVSVGIENEADLRGDLLRGFKVLGEELGAEGEGGTVKKEERAIGEEVSRKDGVGKGDVEGMNDEVEKMDDEVGGETLQEPPTEQGEKDVLHQTEVNVDAKEGKLDIQDNHVAKEDPRVGDDGV